MTVGPRLGFHHNGVGQGAGPKASFREIWTIQEMEVRRRNVGSGTAPRAASNEDAEEDKKPLITSYAEQTEAGEESGSSAARTPPSVLQVRSMTNFITDLRKIDMDDVYRYWSILRDWLADVPTLARKVTCDLPVALSSLSFGLGSRPVPLTAEQAKALEVFIEENVSKPYSHEEHFGELVNLWRLSFPNTETVPEQKDPQWKRLGFQGNDPATDFRSAGILSVRAIVHFAEAYPTKYKDVMMRTHGKSAEESYPFACAAINIVFMLTDLMKLRRADETPSSDVDAAVMRSALARMLERDSKAFLDLFCVCMMALDNEWVRADGTYMKFPIILRTTKEKISGMLKNPNLKSASSAADLLKVNLYGD